MPLKSYSSCSPCQKFTLESGNRLWHERAARVLWYSKSTDQLYAPVSEHNRMDQKPCRDAKLDEWMSGLGGNEFINKNVWSSTHLLVMFTEVFLHADHMLKARYRQDDLQVHNLESETQMMERSLFPSVLLSMSPIFTGMHLSWGSLQLNEFCLFSLWPLLLLSCQWHWRFLIHSLEMTCVTRNHYSQKMRSH